MAKAKRPVLLVGGIPGDTAEEVFRTVAPVLGDLAAGLPDGEIGGRRLWVFYIANETLRKHPDIVCVREPVGAPGLPKGVSRDYEDLPKFVIKDGVKSLRFDTLHYPAEAEKSYAVFKTLRDQGVIPKGTRFQVCIPFPEDAMRLFTSEADTANRLIEAYVDVMQRDVAKICAAIPHQDLLLQWDINWEVIAVEANDIVKGREPMDFALGGDPMKRYAGYVNVLSRNVPEAVALGLHLCYGDFHHRHYFDPKDLGAAVRMGNIGVDVAGRKVDYVHMPVPRARHDDAFFEPLKDQAFKGATLYMGLVHYTDGVEGTRRRIEAFKRHYDGPAGVATECGLGRRPKDHNLDTLLKIHRDAVGAL